MTVFSSLRDLENYLNDKINNALENEVANVSRETMKRNIEMVVYDRYKPSQYTRHKENGGLLDDRNIVTELIDDNTLYIRNIRQDTDKYGNVRDVARIVEEGEPYTWEYSRIYSMQPYPRPFHEETAKELSSRGLAKKALAEGLQKQGIKVV